MVGLLVLILCVTSAVRAFADDASDNGSLSIADVGTIPAPADGFHWKLARASDNTAAPKMEMFIASKKGETAKVLLILERTEARTDGQKAARIKAAYNAVVDLLNQQGDTDLQGEKPPIIPPIGVSVTFAQSAKRKDGNVVALQNTLIF